MSRVGKKPIVIPSGVKVAVIGDHIEAEGPRGKLSTTVPRGIRIEESNGELRAVPESQMRELRPFWGLARSLVANAVQGVSEGFTKQLDIVGIGYRAQLEGDKVIFALGYSQPIDFPIPSGVTIQIEKQTRITVSGVDKQLVGETAARIRQLRKPDPYKQKGVRYVGEQLKKRAGKTGAT
jgi:large subunit ribosomal protein L6